MLLWLIFVFEKKNYTWYVIVLYEEKKEYDDSKRSKLKKKDRGRITAAGLGYLDYKTPYLLE